MLIKLKVTAKEKEEYREIENYMAILLKYYEMNH